MTSSRLVDQAFQTEAHQASMAWSRSGPGGSESARATEMRSISALNSNGFDGERAAIGREVECRPVLALPGEAHVGLLDLAAGVGVLQVEVEADQGEGETDGPIGGSG